VNNKENSVNDYMMFHPITKTDYTKTNHNQNGLPEKINILKEMVVSLYQQINEKQTLQDQQTQCSTSYRDASTQTTDSTMPSKPKTKQTH
jgi:hypothetical protein